MALWSPLLGAHLRYARDAGPGPVPVDIKKQPGNELGTERVLATDRLDGQ
jgi:hypothetical protein